MVRVSMLKHLGTLVKRMLFIITPKLHIALCTRLWQQKGTGESQSHFKWYAERLNKW